MVGHRREQAWERSAQLALIFPTTTGGVSGNPLMRILERADRHSICDEGKDFIFSLGSRPCPVASSRDAPGREETPVKQDLASFGARSQPSDRKPERRSRRASRDAKGAIARSSDGLQ